MENFCTEITHVNHLDLWQTGSEADVLFAEPKGALLCNCFHHTLLLLGMTLAMWMVGRKEGTCLASAARANLASWNAKHTVMSSSLPGYLCPVVWLRLSFSGEHYSSLHFISCL